MTRTLIVTIVAIMCCAIAATAAGVLDGVHVVVLTRYLGASDEKPNILYILDLEDARVTETDTTDANELQSLLRDADVLLIPDQEDASESTIVNVGEHLAPTLLWFLQNGGQIVALTDGYEDDGGDALLKAAGLTTASSKGFSSDSRSLEIALYGDPLVLDPFAIPASFSGDSETGYFTDLDADAEAIVISDDSNKVPVVCRLFRGNSDIILIAFDYNDYNGATENLLLNACNFNKVVIDCSSRIFITEELAALTGTYENQACLNVPASTMLVGIAIEGEVDLFLRRWSEVSPKGDVFDFSFVSSGNQEMAVSSTVFASGRWFAAVANPRTESQEYTLTILPVPTLIDIADESGFLTSSIILETPISAVNDYLQTSQGMLCTEQYVVQVSTDITSLVIRVSTSGSANVYLRHETPVTVEGNQALADISGNTAGGLATLSLAGDWLRSGTYYIAIEGVQAQEYEIEVVLK